MFYTVATFLAFKGIAQATYDAMDAEKRAELLTEQAKSNEEYFKELESSIENKVSVEELNTLKEAHANIIKTKDDQIAHLEGCLSLVKKEADTLRDLIDSQRRSSNALSSSEDVESP
jgi:hypothetical protein